MIRRTGFVRPPGRLRAGYALIEMLAVMSVSAVILAVLYLALSGLVRRFSEKDTAAARARATSTAVRALRGGLDMASDFEIADGGTRLVSKSPDGRSVVWRLAERPFRLERADSNAATPGIFGLTGFEKGRFERFEIAEGRRPMAALVLVPENRANRRTGVAVVEAPVRFEFSTGTRAKPAAATGEAGEKPK